MALHKVMAMLSQIISTWVGVVECKVIWKATGKIESPPAKYRCASDDKHQRKVKFHILLYRKICPLGTTVNVTESRIS